MTINTPSKKLVFISFAGQDSQVWRDTFKEELGRCLGETFELFYSEKAPIMSGRLESKLVEKLDATHALVSLIGPGYLNSSWCRLEIEKFFKERADRKDRFVAICLTKTVFDGVEAWDPWKAAGLSGFAKVPLYDKNGDAFLAKLQGSDGTSEINQYFSKKVQEVAHEVMRILALPEEPAGDQSAPPLIVIGAVSKTLESSAKELEQSILEKVGSAKVRLIRMTKKQLENDDPADSEIAKALSGCALFIVPVADEHPMLVSSGGHVQMQKDRWEQAQSEKQSEKQGTSLGVPKLLFWDVAGVDIPEEERAKSKHADFLKELPKLRMTPVELASQVKQLLYPEYPPPPGSRSYAQIAQIVIEANTKEEISPEPLKARMEKLWQKIQRELPETQGVGLSIYPMSVARMRAIKKDLHADAIILLWGRKDDGAVFAQIESVDRDCSPPKRFLAYLAPPQSKKLEESHLGWDLVPFHVRKRRNGATVVKEFNVASANVKTFLTALALGKQRGDSQGD